MGLDITIKERKEFRCPDCGRLVTTKDIDAEGSSGRGNLLWALEQRTTHPDLNDMPWAK